MVEFNSPLGNKKFSAQVMKEYDVPDENNYPEQLTAPPMRQRQNVPPDMDAIRDFQARMHQIQGVDVDEERIEQERVAREIRAERIAKKSGKERLSDGARKRIEILIGMTRATRSFELDGNVYSLQTLKSREMREALFAASEFDGTVMYIFELRKQYLARSLTQVAGLEINQFIGSNTLEAKLEFIDDQDHAFLNRVYKEYVLLTTEADEKYAIKTAEDVKEVLEDLKK